MTNSSKQIFQATHDALRIWDAPQFTVAEVCQITGATPKALEHFLTPSRGLVRLMGEWVNPGTGKRRIFTGSQVLKIAAAYAMNRIGFPQRWSIELTELVGRRATERTNGLAMRRQMTIVTYPTKDGDWTVVPIYDEQAEEPKLPVAAQMLDVDRLIDEVKEQLGAIVAGEDAPDFSSPNIAPQENHFAPKSNFFKMWEKEGAGNWLLVGLTLEESKEYMAIQGWELNGDNLTYFDVQRDPDQLERSVDLSGKHEAARMAAIGGDKV